MKRIIILSTIIFSLIVLSCSKNTERLFTTDFALEEAKAAFVNNYSAAIGTKSADVVYYSLAGGDYTPVWEMAKANENEHIWSLEVPIISDLQIVLKNKETELVTGAERKLLFIKSKETQNVHPFIMVSTTSEVKSNTNSFEHLADNTSYTGYVLYSTLAGEFVNLRSYENGEEIANVNATTAEAEHHHDCDSTCTDHVHNLSLEEVMGNNEFGIMPLGMGGGEYFEGFCLICGAPQLKCWCEDVRCLYCGRDFLSCDCGKIICDKCGQLKMYSEILGLICGCYEMNEDIKCEYCGEKHKPNNCKYICPICLCHLLQCKCK
jgi:hypothetical protein